MVFRKTKAENMKQLSESFALALTKWKKDPLMNMLTLGYTKMIYEMSGIAERLKSLVV